MSYCGGAGILAGSLCYMLDNLQECESVPGLSTSGMCSLAVCPYQRSVNHVSGGFGPPSSYVTKRPGRRWRVEDARSPSLKEIMFRKAVEGNGLGVTRPTVGLEMDYFEYSSVLSNTSGLVWLRVTP